MASIGGNEQMVESLYSSLYHGDTMAVAAAMAPDLEWWFHGPPGSQHMMRVLTGEASHREFRFKPRRVAEVGLGWVVAEGWEGENSYWVHVWAVENGVIKQVREYFNTSIVVRELSPPSPLPSPEICCSAWEDGRTLWQSDSRELPHRSLPGLVLAI